MSGNSQSIEGSFGAPHVQNDLNLYTQLRANAMKIQRDPRTKQYETPEFQRIFVRDNTDGTIDKVTQQGIKRIPVTTLKTPLVYIERLILDVQRQLWKVVR